MEDLDMLEFKLEVVDWVHHLATQAGAFADIYGASASIGGARMQTASYGPFKIISMRYVTVPAPIVSRAREINKDTFLRLGDWVGEELAIQSEFDLVLHVERTRSIKPRIIEYKPGEWERHKIFNIDSLFEIQVSEKD